MNYVSTEIMEFQDLSAQSMELHGNSKPDVDKAWNSMNYVSTEIMEFQDLSAYSMEFLGIPSLTQIKHAIP